MCFRDNYWTDFATVYRDWQVEKNGGVNRILMEQPYAYFATQGSYD